MRGEENKSEAPRWKLLRVSDVKPAPHNPADRVTKLTLKPLVQSMARLGLFYPVLVDSDNVLIDGHRRLAAAKVLGWQTIAAIVADQAPAAEVYAEVNGNARKIRGHQHLQAWLVNPAAVGGRLAKELAVAREEFGVRLLKRLAEKNMSPRVIYIARRVASYCDCDARDALKWLIETALVGRVLKAMATGISKEEMAEAVRKNKPL